MTASGHSGPEQRIPITLPADRLASVSAQEQDGVIVTTVRGEIDVSNASRIGGELMEIPNDALGLVVDLGQLEYLDSAGIALLHDLQLRLDRRGQALVVIAPAQGTPRRVLELTAFAKRTPVTDDLDAAVTEVRTLIGRGSPPG